MIGSPPPRVLFAALPNPGHLPPLIPVAHAFVAAGYQVTVATEQSAHATLRAEGLTPFAAGIDARSAVAAAASRLGDHAAAAERTAEAFGNVAARVVARDIGDLLDRERPDLVVAELGCAGAMLAAALRDVPCTAHGLGLRPDGRGVPLAQIQTRFADLIAEHGLTPPPPGGVLADVYLDPCPLGLGAAPVPGAAPRLPIRPIPWAARDGAPPPPRRLPRPFAYVTLGTVFDGSPVLGKVIDGLRDLDVFVAAGATDMSQIGPQPEGVKVEAWVDQAAALQQADLIVHHGGSGTMLAAAASGVPQLIIPRGADQFLNAAAIERIGAGTVLDAVDPVGVARAARRLLAGQAAEGVCRLARAVAAMPAPEVAVADLCAFWGLPHPV